MRSKYRKKTRNKSGRSYTFPHYSLALYTCLKTRPFYPFSQSLLLSKSTPCRDLTFLNLLLASKSPEFVPEGLISLFFLGRRTRRLGSLGRHLESAARPLYQNVSFFCQFGWLEWFGVSLVLGRYLGYLWVFFGKWGSGLVVVWVKGVFLTRLGFVLSGCFIVIYHNFYLLII